jgi:putative endopeptidase
MQTNLRILTHFLRNIAPAAIFGCAALLIPFSIALAQNTNTNTGEIDRAVKPGDDFYRYANGGWLKTAVIPAGQSSFDTRAVLKAKTNERVRNLIQEAAAPRSAASHSGKDGISQKVGDFYAGFMDQQDIESKGLTPLADEMARINAITNKASLSVYLGATLNTEIDGLTANADHIFGLWVCQSFHDSKHNYPHLWQGGLGMPDRDSYLDPSPKMAELRMNYQAHIAVILKLAGIPEPDTRAAGILALEILIARSHAPDSDAADVFKQDNPWKRADFPVKAPGMDWDAYFKAAGLAGQSDFIVWQPTAVTGTSALVSNENIDEWKDYLKFHLIEHYSGVLPISGGAAPDREKAAIAATNGALSQAVGQLYTRAYFPSEAKAKVQAMVHDLLDAYRARIPNIPWMSPQTKEKALTKLAAFTIGVGYPDKWIDYSTLNIRRGDAFGNMRRAEAFNRLRSLTQLKQPADPAEWRIDAQSFGAVIMFTPNSEFFAAPLFQPPFFDPQGDTASNYGSAGAGMTHEITHSFDELGNIYDDQGRLVRWWADKDTAEYHAKIAKLANQFDAYCPLSDLCVDGKQVMSENSADLAGLSVAYDAYILSLKGRADTVINGLTGEQRFFLAFAQRWRNIQSDTALRRQIKTDTHAPGEYRSDTVRNLDAWYTAYGAVSGDKLYLKPEDRVTIW